MINFIKKYKFCLILFVVLQILVLSMISYEKDNRKDKHLNLQTKLMEIEYKTIYNMYKKLSDNTFRGIINKAEIIDVFKDANDATKQERIVIRERLYKLLKDDYPELKKLGFKQIHFHLPNNESFLRLHKLDKFGDNLTDIRYSVKYVNEYKKPIDGLEEGRIVHGFRYVYPLFSKSRTGERVHIGSVETSIFSKAFKLEMEQHFDVDVHFLMDKKVIDKKLFKDSKINYLKSRESDSYLYSSEYLEYKDTRGISITSFDKELKSKIEENIKVGKSFTVCSYVNNKHKIGTFIALKNIKDKKVIAYFVVYQSSPYLDELHRTYLIFVIASIFGVLLVTLFLYRIKYTRGMLEEKINQKTLELKELNQNLENQISLEINKNKEKEKLISQQSKMASMGEMLANIAHQWRQPLNSISVSASSMQLQKELGLLSDKQFENGVDGIVESTNFLSQTIEDFQNFLKPDKEITQFDLEDSIKKSLSLVLATLSKNGIEECIEVETTNIKGVKGEFSQVLLNIINNAKDALIENNDILERFIFINSTILKDKVIITIKDNAGGIPKENIKKIFKQYFTTKDVDGTGIGLHMSKIIVEAHMQGKLYVENIEFTYKEKNYIGAQFTIELPIS